MARPWEEQLQEDTQRLKAAIDKGSCTVSEWKPYSAIVTAKTLHGSRTEGERLSFYRWIETIPKLQIRFCPSEKCERCAFGAH